MRPDRLGDLVVKASASRAEDPGFESRLRRDFFGVRVILNNWHSSGYPARRLGQRWDWLARCQYTSSEVESWICSFYLSAAARQIIRADPSLRYTRMLLGREATNKQHLLHPTRTEGPKLMSPLLFAIHGREIPLSLGLYL